MRALGFALALAIGTAAGAAPVTIKTAQGALTGDASDGVASFKGIPFAAPPVGKLRWMPPMPAASWKGARAATVFGPVCPQPVTGSAGGGVDAGMPQSEDCLTLNIYAPAGAKAAPVMVWLHGGGHHIGASSLPYYDGTSFAKRGVVLVAVNYRLGPLGYFAHPALTAEAKPDAPLANYGAMDQQAALKWVQANIAAFGGDPGNVTLFGESAGGSSTLSLLANPARSKGLFAKAIVESGGGWGRAITLADGEKAGAEIAVGAGAPANADAAALRALPVDKLIAAPATDFGPIVDGRFYTTTPTVAFATGTALDVPLVIGANSDEGSLMGEMPKATGRLALITGDMDAAKAVYGITDDRSLTRAIFGDVIMVGPARFIARSAAGGAPAWLYHFSYVPEAARGLLPGASHGLEVPFVFGTVSAIKQLASVLTPGDRAQADKLNACWAAFATTGTPCKGVTDWPAYGSDDRLLEFGSETALRGGFRKPQLDLQEARVRALAAKSAP